MVRFWEYVDSEKEPEATVENVPDQIIKQALSWATVYKKCTNCGTEQFLYFRPGHNTTGECKNCGEEDII